MNLRRHSTVNDPQQQHVHCPSQYQLVAAVTNTTHDTDRQTDRVGKRERETARVRYSLGVGAALSLAGAAEPGAAFSAINRTTCNTQSQ